MAAELQDLVDRLGQKLRRSVAIDDPDLRILAYSDHYGDEDAARLQALVGRGAVGAMRDYLAAHRIHSWTEPRYMEADETIGLKRRLLLPLWDRRRALGFVWIIVDTDLDPADMAAALETSLEAGRILALAADRREEGETRRAGLLGDLVTGVGTVRSAAATALGADGVFATAQNYSVMLLTGASRGTDPVIGGVDGGRSALTRIMARRPWEGYVLARVDEGMVLLLGTLSPLERVAAAEIGSRIAGELNLKDGPPDSGAGLGIGSPVSRLEEVHESFGQARVAARAAMADGRASASWSGLGPAALLPAVIGPELEGHLLPEGFRKLIQGHGAEALRLVETYLDTAGSAAETAELLHLHRSSVYYHLGQFQKLTGWDLGDGNIRFHLHLWFKVGRFLPTVGASAISVPADPAG